MTDFQSVVKNLHHCQLGLLIEFHASTANCSLTADWLGSKKSWLFQCYNSASLMIVCFEEEELLRCAQGRYILSRGTAR